MNVLIQQPEVDPKRISLIGHSEGAIIAPRVAIDNSTKVKNIILMGTPAQNLRDLLKYQTVSLPLQYATQALDKNHTGSSPAYILHCYHWYYVEDVEALTSLYIEGTFPLVML